MNNQAPLTRNELLAYMAGEWGERASGYDKDDLTLLAKTGMPGLDDLGVDQLLDLYVELYAPSTGSSEIMDHRVLAALPREIALPCFGIMLTLNNGAGSIESDIYAHLSLDGKPNVGAEFASDSLESMILGHCCAGIDVTSPAYVEGIETAVEAIANNLED